VQTNLLYFREFALKKMKGYILNIPVSKLKVPVQDARIDAMESGQSFRKIAGHGRRIQLVGRNEIYQNGIPKQY
jgi:hypothetical protein